MTYANITYFLPELLAYRTIYQIL